MGPAGEGVTEDLARDILHGQEGLEPKGVRENILGDSQGTGLGEFVVNIVWVRHVGRLGVVNHHQGTPET